MLPHNIQRQGKFTAGLLFERSKEQHHHEKGDFYTIGMLTIGG